MAIVIKNLSAPANCAVCPFYEERYDHFTRLFTTRCCANAFEISDIASESIKKWDWMYEKRHSNCPIEEI